MSRIGTLLFVFALSAARLNAQTTNVSLTLTEAISIALAQNPDVAEAQSRLQEAEARLLNAKAGGRPTLRVRGAYDYWTEDQRLFPATKNGEPGTMCSSMR